MTKGINVKSKFDKVEGQWSPHIIAALNDYHVKLARIEGEFVWHSHSDTDELFYIVEGEMNIELRDETIHLKQGDMYVVPKGVEHRPYAEKECKILMVERDDTVNTGDLRSDLTKEDLPWI